MDAAGMSNWVSRARAFEPARLLQAAAALTMLLLALAGVMLLARRMSGAFTAPPSAAALVLVGVLLASAGLGFRRMMIPTGSPFRAGWRVAAVPSAVSVLWLAALSLPQTSGWGLALLFGTVLLAEGWSWGALAGQGVAQPTDSSVLSTASPGPTASTSMADAATTTSAPLPSRTTAPDAPAVNEVEEIVLTGDQTLLAGNAWGEPGEVELEELAERDENALQHQTRRRDEEAGEVIEGWVRVDFAAGQRHAAAHIAICPPLQGKPTCYAEHGEGPDATVKITQAMSYGVRLEVKLAETADEPASVIVEYSILEHAAASE